MVIKMLIFHLLFPQAELDDEDREMRTEKVQKKNQQIKQNQIINREA